MSRTRDVVVIGEALVDIVERDDVRTALPGGSPANVAVGLGRAGRDVALIGRLGGDDLGGAVRRHLEASGVDVSLVQRAARTSTAVAHLAADGSADYRFDISWELEPDTGVPPSRLLHVGSIGAWMKPGADIVHRLVEARPDGVRASFDPNIRQALIADRDEAVRAIERLMAVCDLVKLSDEDAAWLYPGRAEADVLELIIELGAGIAAITSGSGGATIRGRDTRSLVTVSAHRVVVVDTIGAGDAFMAGVLDAWLDDPGTSADPSPSSLSALAERGTAVAAATVARPGADPPWCIERPRSPHPDASTKKETHT